MSTLIRQDRFHIVTMRADSGLQVENYGGDASVYESSVTLSPAHTPQATQIAEGCTDYRSSLANLLNSLRSVVSRNTHPNSGWPRNLLVQVVNPLLYRSRYGESI